MIGDIWNPWHGCRKVSEGCDHCYMYCLDGAHGKSGSEISRVKTNFNLPLKRDRRGGYKIKSGQCLRVCMTSDFFLEEADAWRDEVWDMIRLRSDVRFRLLTKRPQRIRDCGTPFSFLGTGNVFVKDGIGYRICKAYQHAQVLRSGLQYPPVDQDVPMQGLCRTCKGGTCNGCRWCGKCRRG